MSKIASTFWNTMSDRFVQDKNKYGFKNLCQWPVIQQTMFMKNPNWVKKELDYLRSLADWDTKWKSLIKESDVGNPIRCTFYPDSSGNLIHTAYHIAKFEEKTKCTVESMNTIFEFGGGYGLMCKLIHDLGFVGQYTIYDLPEFVKLQEYYLDKFSYNFVRLLSEKDLPKLETVHAHKLSLFIATWSLSEAPISMRNLVLRQLSGFTNYLIAYQISFESISNIKYFEEFAEERTNIKWWDWEIQHIPENYYMVGRKKYANEMLT